MGPPVLNAAARAAALCTSPSVPVQVALLQLFPHIYKEFLCLETPPMLGSYAVKHKTRRTRGCGG